MKRANELDKHFFVQIPGISDSTTETILQRKNNIENSIQRLLHEFSLYVSSACKDTTIQTQCDH